ncbi:MAG: hypothetical protein RLZZ609_2984 [Cyanobacteriota bacterium]|jgi:hypothetical protein
MAQANARPVPLDPNEVFCNRPRNRVDAAVGQGLSILAGLALGVEALVAASLLYNER